MIAPWWLAASLAFAHGGDDHASPPPAAATADAARVATWSTEFDVVLRLDDLEPGEAGKGTLLVADARTSAPVAAGAATLALEGPAKLSVEAKATERPGYWSFDAKFPSEGPWHGGITLLTPDRADSLGLPEFHLDAHEHADATPAGAPPWVFVVGGVILAFGLGFATGRSRGAAATLLALGVVGGSRGWAHGGDEHAAPAAPVASSGGVELRLESQFLLGLRTLPVATEPFVETVRALGTTVARPGGAAEVRAPLSGIVAFAGDRTLLPGSMIRAGDPLFEIVETLGGAERSSYVASRAAAKVELVSARKKLQLAQRDLERASELGEVLSARERLEREAAVQVAREAVRQAESAAGALDLARPTTLVRAPLDGRIGALLARPGESVATADPLVRITDAGGLWVEVAVPEVWSGRFAVGGRAELYAGAKPGHAFAASILDPGSEADPVSGTLHVILATEGPIDGLVPGMTVTASIDTGGRRDAVVVPDDAVVDGSGEALVFVKSAPELFEPRPVRLGALSGDRREVLEGVAPGERVVVDGTYALRSLAGR